MSVQPAAHHDLATPPPPRRATHTCLGLMALARSQPLRQQSFSDPVARGFGCDDGGHVASSNRGGEQAAHVIQEQARLDAQQHRVSARAWSRGDGKKRGERRHEEPSGDRVIDGACKIRLHPCFQDVAVRPGFDGGGHEFVRVVHRHHDDPGARPGLLQFTRCLKTVEFRHGDVEDGHVWIQPPRRVQCLPPITDRGDDFKVPRETRGRFCQDGRIVVSHQNPQSAFAVVPPAMQVGHSWNYRPFVNAGRSTRRSVSATSFDVGDERSTAEIRGSPACIPACSFFMRTGNDGT